jgi:hypothetical protein
MDDLRAAWGAPEQIRNVIWPLTLRIGRCGLETAAP